jgi:signal peptidase I
VASLLVVVIRLFVFTIYTVPAPLGQALRTGDRVVVNKFPHCQNFRRGDLIVYTVSGEAPAVALVGPPQELGQIVNVPGDTIRFGKTRYYIPYKCCDRCPCEDCCLYLVDNGHGKRLVHKHQIVGKAARLFK